MWVRAAIYTIRRQSSIDVMQNTMQGNGCGPFIYTAHNIFEQEGTTMLQKTIQKQSLGDLAFLGLLNTGTTCNRWSCQ